MLRVWDGRTEDIPHARPLKGSADEIHTSGALDFQNSELCRLGHPEIQASGDLDVMNAKSLEAQIS